MAKITQKMIEASYQYGKQYALGKMTFTESKKTLISETEINPTSAHNAIYIMKYLLNGEVYSRTMNAQETIWKLEKIKLEFGAESYFKALSAVEKHLNYYENLSKGGPQRKIRSYVNQNIKSIETCQISFDNEKLLDEDNFEEQEEIQRAVAATDVQAKNSSIKELHIIVGNKTELIVKDIRVSKYALKTAEFLCQIDCGHETFITKQNNNYMEGHHLIPCTVTNSKLFKQKYNKNIDCCENIVSLCPICHRAVHLGSWDTKEKLLKIMFKKHSDKLKQIGIILSEDELLNLYKK